MDERALVAALRGAGCVFAEEEAALLLAEQLDEVELAARLTRRTAGEPLETVLGWVDFDGLRLEVVPGVFVPRRRTVLLARSAAGLARPGGVVIDLCCGVGAVAAVVARDVPGVVLHAADVDLDSVEVARRNLAGQASVHLGDFDAALPLGLVGRVDVLAANVPYVPTDEIARMPPEARDHESLAALDGGADGTRWQQRLAGAATRWLAPGGHVLVETSDEQEPLTRAHFERHGLSTRTITDDDVGGTVVVGRRS